MNILGVFFIFTMIVGLGITMYGAIEYGDKEMEIVEVDCFDRLGHKIIDQVCEKEVDKLNDYLGVGLLTFMGSITLGIVFGGFD